MIQNVVVVYLGECSMWAWEEYTLCYCCMKKSVSVDYVQLCWLIVLLSSTMSLMIFCLLDLSISDTVMLKSPTMIDLPISPCSSISFLPHIFWWSIIRHIHIKDCYIFLDNWSFYHYVMPLIISNNLPCSEVSTVWNYYSYSCFLLMRVNMVNLSLTFYL